MLTELFPDVLLRRTLVCLNHPDLITPAHEIIEPCTCAYEFEPDCSAQQRMEKKKGKTSETNQTVQIQWGHRDATTATAP